MQNSDFIIDRLYYEVSFIPWCGESSPCVRTWAFDGMIEVKLADGQTHLAHKFSLVELGPSGWRRSKTEVIQFLPHLADAESTMVTWEALDATIRRQRELS